MTRVHKHKNSRTLTAGFASIEDPWVEKHLAEQGERRLVEYLVERRGPSAHAVGTLIELDIEKRISEVYRLCSNEGELPHVIKDFAAHFPALAFDSAWLANRVRQNWREWVFGKMWSNQSKSNVLLQSLARGLLQATKPNPRIRNSLLRGRAQAALGYRKVVYKDLRRIHEHT